MKMSLVINGLLVIFLVACAVSLQSTNANSGAIKIIDSELRNAASFLKDKEEMYLKFECNKTLISYIEEVQNPEYSYRLDLMEQIGSKAYEAIFKESELLAYKTQLNQKIKKNAIILPENVIFLDINNEVDEGSILEYSRQYIYLSYPVFSANGQFALICSARGVKNGMEGGIRVYKNEKSEWVLYKTINSWIE